MLVTGGASFIGSHMVDTLVQRRAVVRLANDFKWETKQSGTSSEEDGPVMDLQEPFYP
jgi:nucleoside-diphosphate-sugar epimerase